MTFDDFRKNYTQLELCNISADSLIEDLSVAERRRWQEVRHRGSWIRKVNAGGSRNNRGTSKTDKEHIKER